MSNKHQLAAPCSRPNRQPRHVLRPGIELAIFHFAGQRLNQLATPVRAHFTFLMVSLEVQMFLVLLKSQFISSFVTCALSVIAKKLPPDSYALFWKCTAVTLRCGSTTHLELLSVHGARQGPYPELVPADGHPVVPAPHGTLAQDLLTYMKARFILDFRVPLQDFCERSFFCLQSSFSIGTTYHLLVTLRVLVPRSLPPRSFCWQTEPGLCALCFHFVCTMPKIDLCIVLNVYTKDPVWLMGLLNCKNLNHKM